LKDPLPAKRRAQSAGDLNAQNEVRTDKGIDGDGKWHQGPMSEGHFASRAGLVLLRREHERDGQNAHGYQQYVVAPAGDESEHGLSPWTSDESNWGAIRHPCAIIDLGCFNLNASLLLSFCKNTNAIRSLAMDMSDFHRRVKINRHHDMTSSNRTGLVPD
jgi:hypothetical protein